jgi:DNA-binding response OmpR family regulator
MSRILDEFLNEVKNCVDNKIFTKDEIFKMVAKHQNHSFIIKDNMILDRDNLTVKMGDDKPQRLEKLAFNLLVYLMNQEGRTIERNKLLTDVWGSDVIVSGRSLDVAICKIRNVVGGNKIHTVKKMGYKFEIL